MNKEFLIGLTAVIIILETVVIIMLAVGFYGTVSAPATVYCNSAGYGKRITYSLPDGYDLNFRIPYNVIDTEDGLDVIFHFSKED